MRKLPVLIITTAILAVVILLVCSLYSEYGGHNLQLATREYMKRKGGAWPKSWEDIEPYHNDILFFGKSVAPAKWFWNINWSFDPDGEDNVPAKPGEPDGDTLPAIYRRAKYPADGSVEHWTLPRLLKPEPGKPDGPTSRSPR